MAEEVVEPALQFFCPFCGQLCTASTNGELSGILHALPTCQKFDRTDDPVDFLAACRAEFAKTAPS